MIARYSHAGIGAIWTNESKLALWQRTELSALQAKAELGLMPQTAFEDTSRILLATPIDIKWWLAKDKEINHDYNAFLEERIQHLSLDLQRFFHEPLTSYDGEEPAFAEMLRQSLEIMNGLAPNFAAALKSMALLHRHSIMRGRTHGQGAKLQSFGKRCLTWFQDFNFAYDQVNAAAEKLKYSKLSGAVGNYGLMDPRIEERALGIMGLIPYYGSTQIMPRILYSPLAEALSDLVELLNKIALDIRLGARSGNPIYREPFGKSQKGSSAMPDKQNTITTERIEGMARMAISYALGIKLNITTWEERAIEQSCLERGFWPDLFHVAVYCVNAMANMITGLRVYPDNMLREIQESRGCYAAEEAKGFLKEEGFAHGLSAEDAYRIVQLAAFNVHEPSSFELSLRSNLPETPAAIDLNFEEFGQIQPAARESIQQLVAEGHLHVSPELKATEDDVNRWNDLLLTIFSDVKSRARWNDLFRISNIVASEQILYDKILGD